MSYSNKLNSGSSDSEDNDDYVPDYFSDVELSDYDVIEVKIVREPSKHEKKEDCAKNIVCDSSKETIPKKRKGREPVDRKSIEDVWNKFSAYVEAHGYESKSDDSDEIALRDSDDDDYVDYNNYSDNELSENELEEESKKDELKEEIDSSDEPKAKKMKATLDTGLSINTNVYEVNNKNIAENVSPIRGVVVPFLKKLPSKNKKQSVLEKSLSDRDSDNELSGNEIEEESKKDEMKEELDSSEKTNAKKMNAMLDTGLSINKTVHDVSNKNIAENVGSIRGILAPFLKKLSSKNKKQSVLEKSLSDCEKVKDDVKKEVPAVLKEFKNEEGIIKDIETFNKGHDGFI